MKKSMVWLRSQAPQIEDVIKRFSDENWSIYCTSDVGLAEKKIIVDDACLMILEGSFDELDEKRLQAFRQRNPDFPCVILGASNLQWQESAWTEHYPGHSVEEAFGRLLAKFSSYAHSQAEKKRTQRIFNDFMNLQNSFDIRDLNLSLVNILQYVFQEFECENAFWFRSGELEKIKANLDRREAYHLVSIEDSRLTSCPVLAAKPSHLNELSPYFTDLFVDKIEGQECFNGRWKCDDHQFEVVTVLKNDNTVLGHLLLQNPALPLYSKDEDFVRQFQSLVNNLISSGFYFEETRNLSYVDHLTSLFNQRYLPLVLEREVGRVKRYKSRFSVLFIDIDRFKLVNDNNGHVVGSAIISKLGDVLSSCIRESDYGFRFGGDEFVMVLTETGVEEAKAVAERIRLMVEARHFVVDGQKFRITVSVGVACCPEHASSAQEILDLADQAMYHGKKLSRNVIYVAS